MPDPEKRRCSGGSGITRSRAPGRCRSHGARTRAPIRNQHGTGCRPSFPSAKARIEDDDPDRRRPGCLPRFPLRCGEPGADGLRRVGSRSHPDPLLVRMQEALGITYVRPSGSAGVEGGLIALGERGLYVYPVPGLKEWDACPPRAIPRAAGGGITDCRGEPPRYNEPDPRQPAAA